MVSFLLFNLLCIFCWTIPLNTKGNWKKGLRLQYVSGWATLIAADLWHPEFRKLHIQQPQSWGHLALLCIQIHTEIQLPHKLRRQMVAYYVLQTVLPCLRSANYSHLLSHTQTHTHIYNIPKPGGSRQKALLWPHTTVNQGLSNWDATVLQLRHSPFYI